jgi:hypothetical protein
LLQTAATWIRRLDHADSARNSVHVYRIRYGDARQMAKILTAMFIGGTQGSLDSADSQLAPEAGSCAVSSADKGHGVPQNFILAYKWLNPAAARSPKHERDYFLRLRNAVASNMSPMQIAEGQWLAMFWGTTRPIRT